MDRTALIQVLGAIAYGELKAYEGAKVKEAEAVDDAERLAMRTIAAEELRHHKGFVRRLEALGADPERAMVPYRTSLDTYHAGEASGPMEEAVWGYLGEGIADDLLTWLRKVVDEETAAFVDSVIADEMEHEALATARLRALIEADPDGRAAANRAVRRMLVRMAGSGGTATPRFGAFLRLGRGHELVGALALGWARRLRAVGLNPVGLRLPLPLPLPRERSTA